MIVLFVLHLLIAFACGGTAQKKGHSFGNYVALALFFPVIGILVALLLPDKSPAVESVSGLDYLRYQREKEETARQVELERAKRRRVLVGQNGAKLGMLSVNEIVARIESGELDLGDHWLDQELNEWRELRELEGV